MPGLIPWVATLFSTATNTIMAIPTSTTLINATINIDKITNSIIFLHTTLKCARQTLEKSSLGCCIVVMVVRVT